MESQLRFPPTPTENSIHTRGNRLPWRQTHGMMGRESPLNRSMKAVMERMGFSGQSPSCLCQVGVWDCGRVLRSSRVAASSPCGGSGSHACFWSPFPFSGPLSTFSSPSFKKYLHIFIICVWVFCLHVCMGIGWAQFLQRPERLTGSFGTGVTRGSEWPHGGWD
ncbi:sterile alpha motif domain containing 7 [Mus musculus]|nr:sterile alpha motif domain containing 7 [Mus musculus]